LSAATRQKLAGAGTVRIAAALARRGVADATVAGPRPLTAGQEALVGIAVERAEGAAPGSVLVLRGTAVPPPPALLQRSAIAGVVSERPLRAAAELARAGLPIWQGPIAVDLVGRMLLGDRTGLLAFPAALADTVADEAIEAQAYEEFVAEQVSAGGGVYGLHIPSGEQARRAFAQWRRLKRR
jgi:hypothetical protein